MLNMRKKAPLSLSFFLFMMLHVMFSSPFYDRLYSSSRQHISCNRNLRHFIIKIMFKIPFKNICANGLMHSSLILAYSDREQTRRHCYAKFCRVERRDSLSLNILKQFISVSFSGILRARTSEGQRYRQVTQRYMYARTTVSHTFDTDTFTRIAKIFSQRVSCITIHNTYWPLTFRESRLCFASRCIHLICVIPFHEFRTRAYMIIIYPFYKVKLILK